VSGTEGIGRPNTRVMVQVQEYRNPEVIEINKLKAKADRLYKDSNGENRKLIDRAKQIYLKVKIS
jgi:hypothetical protein